MVWWLLRSWTTWRKLSLPQPVKLAQSSTWSWLQLQHVQHQVQQVQHLQQLLHQVHGLQQMHHLRHLHSNWKTFQFKAGMFWQKSSWALNFLHKYQVWKMKYINIAKGTTDPRVEFLSQDHRSQFTNLEHITISESWLSINFKISTKHQHLD